MKGLLTLVPTRNRVENALGLLHTWYDTSKDEDSGLLFIVGTEDPRFEEYMSRLPANHIITFKERGLVKALNYVAPAFTREYEAIGFMGDDHRPRTLGWDSHYLGSLRELGAGYVYGNDLLVGERIPTQVAISSPVIDALGYFGPPCFTHLHVDVSWKVMGEGLGRIKYLPDVIVEHMHPAAGKAEEDAGYKHVNSSMMVKMDKIAFDNWFVKDYPIDLERVGRHLDSLGL